MKTRLRQVKTFFLIDIISSILYQSTINEIFFFILEIYVRYTEFYRKVLKVESDGSFTNEYTVANKHTHVSYIGSHHIK